MAEPLDGENMSIFAMAEKANQQKTVTKRNVEQSAWDPIGDMQRMFGQTSSLDNIIKGKSNTSADSVVENFDRYKETFKSLKNRFFGTKEDGTEVVSAGAAKKATTAISNLTGMGNSGTLVAGDTAAQAAGLIRLANPIFTAGTSELGATVDIYGETLNSPQNTISSIIGDSIDTVLNSVNGIFGGSLKNIVGLTNKFTGANYDGVGESIIGNLKNSVLNGVPLTKDSIKKVVTDAIGVNEDFPGLIKGLANKQQMLDGITKLVDDTTGIIGLYNGVETIIKGDFDTADGVFKIIENITGNSRFGAFFDITNELKVISAVTKSVYNLGIPEVFDKIYDKLTDNNKERYVRENISSAILSGDIDFIRFALKYYSGSWIKSNYPNVIKALVSCYTPTTLADGSVSQAEYQRFLNTLKDIDPNWWVAENSLSEGDLYIFSFFNDHAKMALINEGNRDKIAAVMIAENYGRIFNTLDELEKRYPYHLIRTTTLRR